MAPMVTRTRLFQREHKTISRRRCQLVGEHDETPRSTSVEHGVLGGVYEADTHNGYAQEWGVTRERLEQHSRQQIDLKYMPSSNHNRQQDIRHR